MTAVWTKAERDKALALLPDEGAWFGGGMDVGKSCSRLCVALVIGEVHPGISLHSRFQVLLSAFERHIGNDNAVSWNDDPARTFADVRRAFETLPVVEDEE